MAENGVDTLILGCTHYPVLKEVIAAYLGPEVALVDSAATLADAAAERLESDLALTANRAADLPGKLTFYLSDIPWKFAEVGARFLGQPIGGVTTVNLERNAAGESLVPNRKDGT